MGTVACARTHVRPSISIDATCGRSHRLSSNSQRHAVFAVHHEVRAIAQTFRRHVQRQFHRSGLEHDYRGRQQALPFVALERGQRPFQVRRGIRRHSQRAQNRLLGRRPM